MQRFETKKKLLLLGILSLLFASLGMLPSTVAQQVYAPSGVLFVVNADGVVHVEYSLNIDSTFPRVEVPLLGNSYENLLVLSGDGSALDFTLGKNILTIDSLGTTAATISYNTPDLTTKSGSLWTLSALSPIDSTVKMPDGATIVSLNKVPIEIINTNGHFALEMPLGEQEITYVLTFAEARERALSTLNQARANIEQAQNQGRVNGLGDAKVALNQAQSSFNSANYEQAANLALKATALAQNALAPVSPAVPAEKTSRDAQQLLVTLPLFVILILAVVPVVAVAGFLVFWKGRVGREASCVNPNAVTLKLRKLP